MKVLPLLHNLSLNAKRIFLRADLNIPTDINGDIVDDFRLQRILATINHIQQHNGKVILATHIGRPNAHQKTNYFDKALSTQCIANWLEQHGYTVFLEPDLLRAQQESNQHFSSILLLENLRFFNGEQGNSFERNKLSQLLANLADKYVNDAFGIIHRNDTSVTLLPQQFSPKNRSIGLLIEQELQHLTTIKKNPQQPFILVLGGKKIEDKIALLNQLITAQKNQRASAIVIGGLLSIYFLQAQDPSRKLPVNNSHALQAAKDILSLAFKNNVAIHLPVDVVTIQAKDSKTITYPIESVPSGVSIIDIGINTIANFKKPISLAKTLFINGTMGLYEDKAAIFGTKKILEAIVANTSANTVVGGGDAVAACHSFGVADRMNFLSTGGGATLALLTANSYEKLPALAAFK